MGRVVGVWMQLMDDFGGFKTSVKEVTADGGKIRKLEVEPEDVTELHNPLIKPEWMRRCFL